MNRSELELLDDWRFTASQFVLETSPLRPTTRIFIFQLIACGYSPYVTSSLTKGWGCRLQLLLVSPAQSFSGPSPAGLMTTFYCVRFETPPASRARSPYLYPPGTGWPGYIARYWVPFLSPPTTRRATVELAQVKVTITLPLAVYRQSVRLDVKPLETQD
jgi:hypothetical protein